jgi:hypothetical protein
MVSFLDADEPTARSSAVFLVTLPLALTLLTKVSLSGRHKSSAAAGKQTKQNKAKDIVFRIFMAGLANLMIIGYVDYILSADVPATIPSAGDSR